MKSLLFISLLVLSIVGITSCYSEANTGTKINIPQKDTTFTKVVKTDAEWQSVLSPEAYYVLRKSGTERAFTHEYNNNKEKGTYQCAGCGFALFHSAHKFNSGTGWPSFYKAMNDFCLRFTEDKTYYSILTEVSCARCEGHLGHVFDDGPKPTGLRYCINGVALKFVKGI